MKIYMHVAFSSLAKLENLGKWLGNLINMGYSLSLSLSFFFFFCMGYFDHGWLCYLNVVLLMDEFV